MTATCFTSCSSVSIAVGGNSLTDAPTLRYGVLAHQRLPIIWRTNYVLRPPKDINKKKSNHLLMDAFFLSFTHKIAVFWLFSLRIFYCYIYNFNYFCIITIKTIHIKIVSTITIIINYREYFCYPIICINSVCRDNNLRRSIIF